MSSHIRTCRILRTARGSMTTPSFRATFLTPVRPLGVSTPKTSQQLRGWLADCQTSTGPVVAAECCYGAQLYDPTLTGAKSPGLCNVYLGNGAYGFFGSSTIAYGPDSSNDWADHICQYFWREILLGSSLGSAVLRARQ